MDPAPNRLLMDEDPVRELSARLIEEALRSGTSEDYAAIYNHALTHDLKPSDLWGAFAACKPQENPEVVQLRIQERLEVLSRENPLNYMVGPAQEKEQVAAAREWMRSEFAGQPSISPEQPYVRPSLPQRLYQYRVEDLTKAISVSMEIPRDPVQEEARRLFFKASSTGSADDYAALYNHAYTHDLRPSDVWGSVLDVESKDSVIDQKARVREQIAFLDMAHPVGEIPDINEQMRVAEARRWLRGELGGEMLIPPRQNQGIKIRL